MYICCLENKPYVVYWTVDTGTVQLLTTQTHPHARYYFMATIKTKG